MGLFSSKICPICGGTTPKLLAQKVAGQAICSACANNIMADSALVKKWSIDDLHVHLNYRWENLKTLENFTPTRVMEYEYEVFIDDTKRNFYINKLTEDNPPVFNFDDILGYTINLGFRTVESWSLGMVRVPFKPLELGIMGGISALAEVFSDDDDKDNEYEDITVTLKVNTPYLHEYELCDLSVTGRGQTEYAYDLAREMAKVNIICNLIVSLTVSTSNNF